MICDGKSLPLAFPSYDITWPIREMPHDDMAYLCLSPPGIPWQAWSPSAWAYDHNSSEFEDLPCSHAAKQLRIERGREESIGGTFCDEGVWREHAL